MFESRIFWSVPLALTFTFILGNFTTSYSSEITQQIADGMVIEGKPNTLQQIQIRLKSLGPGVCGVDLQFLDSHEKIAAPPLVWSPWFTFGGAFSGGSHTLSFSEDCSTGALGEVKYNKPDLASSKQLPANNLSDQDCAILKDDARSKELMNQDQERWLALVTRCGAN